MINLANNSYSIAIVTDSDYLFASIRRICNYLLGIGSNHVTKINNVYTNLTMSDRAYLIIYCFPSDYSKDIYSDIYRIQKLKRDSVYFNYSPKDLIIRNYTKSIFSFNQMTEILAQINLIKSPSELLTYLGRIKDDKSIIN